VGGRSEPVVLGRLLSPTVWFLDGRTVLPPARPLRAAGDSRLGVRKRPAPGQALPVVE
jgi:hypothetical protein